MPIDMNYVQAVIQAYANNIANLGQFPNGTVKTVMAAETLKPFLPANNFAGAISVVELRSGLRTIFVVSNSGAPKALQEAATMADFDGANAEVRRNLGEGHSFVYGNHGQDFYNPLHDQTIQQIGNISPNFNGTNNLVTLPQATAVIQDVTQRFLRDLGQLLQLPQQFNVHPTYALS